MQEAERLLIVKVNRLSEQLAKVRSEKALALRERDLSEKRARRWLDDATQMDDEIERLLLHCEREIKKGNEAGVHRYLATRLRRIKEALA